MGYSSLEAYERGAYELIRSLEKVCVEKEGDKTNYIFVKGDRIVISNYDTLQIKTFYKLYDWAISEIEKKLKGDKWDTLIRIL